MKAPLIWDLPIRLFHWSFAATTGLAIVFALAVDDDSPLFQLHMMFGLLAASILVLRLLMGLIGSRHARFGSFPLRVTEVVSYFVGVLTGGARKYAGHNPGSALAALAMFILLPVVVITGAVGGGETFEEVHEVAAYTLLGVIGAHVLGLVLYTFRHRENIALSMVHGRKSAAPEEAIASSHPVWGAAFAAAAIAWGVALFSNHDSRTATVRLPVIGATVQLGENEGGEHETPRGEQKRKHHDDD
jgi:cytochrome b